MLSAVWQAAWNLSCLGCQEGAIEGAQVLCRPCRRSLQRNEGHRCARCDVPLAAATPESLCRSCALLGTGSPVQVRACYLLQGPLHEALLAAKFGGHVRAWRAFAELIASCPEARAMLATADALTFVPSHRQRLAARGYDHAALLALHLGARMGRPVAALLRKTRATAAQSSLSRAARLHNVVGAFEAFPRCRQQHIVLIDDATTTGATLRACAQALLRGGAARVQALCLAHRPL